MSATFGTPAYGAHGVLATPHYLASLAGADVLRDGGSAVDAAIAANLLLAVVWPNMYGPGGDLFAQVFDDGALFGLNASGRAGAAMTLEAYRARGLDAMPGRGPLSVTVPGAVSGWFALHERWGRLDIARLARDAMRHARDGFRVTSFVSEAVRTNLPLLGEHGMGAEVFAPGGRVPGAGDHVTQPELADSLELIATQGPSLLYCGIPIAGSKSPNCHQTRRALRCCRCCGCSSPTTSPPGLRRSACTSWSSAKSGRSRIATPSWPTRRMATCPSRGCSRPVPCMRLDRPPPRRTRPTGTRSTCARLTA